MVRDQIIEEFLSDLSSKNAVPGGGGASALAGAFGVSLAEMVGNLTIGKKKYQAVEETLREDMAHLETLKEVFLRLADKDEAVFLPLAKAYQLPHGTDAEEKTRRGVLERALSDAADVPLSVMETAVSALEVVLDLAENGSKMAVSDAGVAASFLITALEGAGYNVLINAAALEDREKAERYLKNRDKLVRKGQKLEKAVRETVEKRILGA